MYPDGWLQREPYEGDLAALEQRPPHEGFRSGWPGSLPEPKPPKVAPPPRTEILRTTAEPRIAYVVAIVAEAAGKSTSLWIYDLIVAELERREELGMLGTGPPPPPPVDPDPPPVVETREERAARERLEFFERHKALPREDGTRICPNCYKQRRDDTAGCHHCGDVDPLYPPAVAS